MVKCAGLHFQFCLNTAIHLQFLVRVGFNSHSGYNISNALPYKLTHRVSVQIDVVLWLTRTYPSLRDQNNLEAWIPIGQTSVE